MAWYAAASVFSNPNISLRNGFQSGMTGAAKNMAKAALKKTLVQQVLHWFYLGPFVIGKHELDGDPAFDAPFGPVPNIMQNFLFVFLLRLPHAML